MNRLNWQRWMTRGPIVVAGGVLAAVVAGRRLHPPRRGRRGPPGLRRRRRQPPQADQGGGRRQERRLHHLPPDRPRSPLKETLNSAASIATAATPTAKDVQTAHVQPRFPEAWATSANPCGPTRFSTTRRRIRPLRQPRRPAHRRISCGTAGCHRRKCCSPQEHDDPRLHALGRRPVQQRRRPLQAALATARATA